MTILKPLADLQGEISAIVRGERPVSDWLKVGKKAPPDIVSVLTAANMALMRLIAERNPANVAELADMSGQRQSVVSRSLQDLERFGLVRMVREGESYRPEPIT